MLDGIISSFTNIDWEGLGKMFTEGIANGVKNGWTTIKDAVTNVAEGIKNLFKDIFGIASPSKLFAYYGEMLDEGLAEGIDDNDSPVVATESLADKINNALELDSQLSIANSPQLALNGVGSIANGSVGGDIVIPVYIGSDMIDTVVVKAIDRANYKSGGR